MTNKTYFRLTEDGGMQPVFTGSLEDFKADIAKQSTLAKEEAEKALNAQKELLAKVTIEKPVEEMDFLELERYKIDYFDKLFMIKNIEHKLTVHKEQTIDDDYFFSMDSVGKKIEF
jgi:hypothetical protein